MSESEPLSYPPETVLTKAQVAKWLQVGEDMVDTLKIPFIVIGQKGRRRYLAKHVLETLDKGATV